MKFIRLHEINSGNEVLMNIEHIVFISNSSEKKGSIILTTMNEGAFAVKETVEEIANMILVH